MVLLGINGGYNNSDLKALTLAQVKGFESGVLDYRRQKTAGTRITPLWPETVEALRKWLQVRPDCKTDKVFVSIQRGPKFATPYPEGKKCRISSTTERYLNQLGLKQDGKNFGALRSTFADVAKQVGDDTAAKALMGSEDASVFYEHYAGDVDFKRLKKVTDFIHTWLYGDKPKKAKKETPQTVKEITSKIVESFDKVNVLTVNQPRA